MSQLSKRPRFCGSPLVRPLRFLLGGALLCGVTVVAASCVDALDLSGHRDAHVEACEVITRCFGPSFEQCPQRMANLNEWAADAWLDAAGECLLSCSRVNECLDFQGVCYDVGGACKVDADCCGFTAGAAACAGDTCCQPSGATCDPSADQCCVGQGPCDPVTFTCGGVQCAPPGEPCLNSFLCCTGNCEGGKCAKAPCPPVGFLCEANEDCCDLVCRDGKCADPDDCALIAQTCSDSLPCCDPTLDCYKPANGDGIHGICTNGDECFPSSSDCFSDVQCCSGLCDDDYGFCAACETTPGNTCSLAVPCCPPLLCIDGLCL
jgi:hypothetical protein